MAYEQRSTLFGDPVIANAILDRLLHHSHIVSIVGPSYRIKDVMDSFEN
ncbi:ATP-binding protein [Holdemanella porci]